MTSRRHRGEDALGRALRSPLVGLAARPWFDRLALVLLARWFFPLSRLWAAAGVAGGAPERFFAEVPMRPLADRRGRLEALLGAFETARAAAAESEAHWRAGFFGDAEGDAAGRAALEAERLDRKTALNGMRRHFAFLGAAEEVAPVRWQLPSPDEVAEVYGPALADPDQAFAPPARLPLVAVSRPLPVPGGTDFWLGFDSPSARLGDAVMARVHAPAGVDDPPTLIFGHGVCVEFDHWRGLIDDVAALVGMGVRVVRPEAPWHGWRLAPGRYAGEPMLATAPLGALDLFGAAAAEWAVLADWCRRTSAGPLAMGGISLGAMTAQFVAARARAWPRRLRPDALLLITHCGRQEDVVFEGALARVLEVVEAAEARGWTREGLARWLALLDADEAPPTDPRNIVTVLGLRDDVTPFAGGKALIDAWGVPPENAFLQRRGHFSVALGLLRDEAPLRRLCAVLQRLADG